MSGAALAGSLGSLASATATMWSVMAARCGGQRHDKAGERVGRRLLHLHLAVVEPQLDGAQQARVLRGRERHDEARAHGAGSCRAPPHH